MRQEILVAELGDIFKRTLSFFYAYVSPSFLKAFFLKPDNVLIRLSVAIPATLARSAREYFFIGCRK